MANSQNKGPSLSYLDQLRNVTNALTEESFLEQEARENEPLNPDELRQAEATRASLLQAIEEAKQIPAGPALFTPQHFRRPGENTRSESATSSERPEWLPPFKPSRNEDK